MRPRGKQPDHSDWNPLAVPKGYRDGYDRIKWNDAHNEMIVPKETKLDSEGRVILREGYEPTVEGTNERFRLVKIEELPFHIDCGGECDLVTPADPKIHPDLYTCKKCGEPDLEEEMGEIEWKKREPENAPRPEEEA